MHNVNKVMVGISDAAESTHSSVVPYFMIDLNCGLCCFFLCVSFSFSV